jgi:hypothetical protein
LTIKSDKEKRQNKATRLPIKTILTRMSQFWTNGNKMRMIDVLTLKLTLWGRMLICERKSKLSKRQKNWQKQSKGSWNGRSERKLNKS